MNHQKQRVKVDRSFCIRRRSTFGRRNFGVIALVALFCVDQDDHVEEEGNEDEGDAAEDPLGKDGQTCGIGGGRC